MRILHLISGGDTGGAKTHIISLLAGLTTNPEVTVRLVSFRDGDFCVASRNAGIDIKVIKSSNPLQVLRLLVREIREGRYDMLHSHGTKGNFFALLLKLLTKLPTLCTVHSDSRLDYMHNKLKQLTLGSLNAFSIRHLDFQAVVSGSMGSLLIQRGFNPQRIFKIYNGLDFSSSESPLSQPEPVCKDTVTIGIATRIHPVKDIPTLLRAFAKAYAVCPRLRLVIAGDGPGRDALEHLAEELGIGDAAVFAGWLDNPGEFYRQIDINVLTSLSENFPYSLLEGVYARRCTVATAVGGIPELIDDEVNGYLVQPGDDDTLAERFVTLANNPKKILEFGELLFEKASQLFSLDAMLSEHVRLYRQVTNWSKVRKNTPRVLICGAYGFGNAGDDGILKAIVGDIRAISPYADISVLSRSPKKTRLTHRVKSFHTFNLPVFWLSALRSALYLNGGGTLITDTTSRRSLSYYLYTIVTAKLLGCRVLLYGCGIGPVDNASGRKHASMVLNRFTNAIVLREVRAGEELARWGVTQSPITVTADPAAGLPPASPAAVQTVLRANRIASDHKLIGIAMRRWKQTDISAAVASALDKLYTTHGFEPVFIPMQPGDEPLSDEIIRLMSAPCHKLRAGYPVESLIGVIGQMDAVLGMRLHSLIFAASQYVPFVGIAYDVKVSSFTNSLLPCCKPFDLEPLCLPFETLDETSLYAALDTMARTRQKNDTLSQSCASFLTENASKNRDILESFLPPATRGTF